MSVSSLLLRDSLAAAEADMTISLEDDHVYLNAGELEVRAQQEIAQLIQRMDLAANTRGWSLESDESYSEESAARDFLDNAIKVLKELIAKVLEYGMRALQAGKEFVKIITSRTNTIRRKLDELEKELASYTQVNTKKLPINALYGRRLQVRGRNVRSTTTLADAFEGYVNYSQYYVSGQTNAISTMQKDLLEVSRQLSGGRYFDVTRAMQKVDQFLSDEAKLRDINATSQGAPMPLIDEISIGFTQIDPGTAQSRLRVVQVDPIKIVYSESLERPATEMDMPYKDDLVRMITVTNQLLDYIDQYRKDHDRLSANRHALTLSLRGIADAPKELGLDTSALGRYASAVKSVNVMDNSLREIVGVHWKQIMSLLYFIDGALAISSDRRPVRF